MNVKWRPVTGKRQPVDDSDDGDDGLTELRVGVAANELSTWGCVHCSTNIPNEKGLPHHHHRLLLARGATVDNVAAQEGSPMDWETYWTDTRWRTSPASGQSSIATSTASSTLCGDSGTTSLSESRSDSTPLTVPCACSHSGTCRAWIPPPASPTASHCTPVVASGQRLAYGIAWTGLLELPLLLLHRSLVLEWQSERWIIGNTFANIYRQLDISSGRVLIWFLTASHSAKCLSSSGAKLPLPLPSQIFYLSGTTIAGDNVRFITTKSLLQAAIDRSARGGALMTSLSTVGNCGKYSGAPHTIGLLQLLAFHQIYCVCGAHQQQQHSAVNITCPDCYNNIIPVKTSNSLTTALVCP